MEDTGAFCIGIHFAVGATSAEEAAVLLISEPTGRENLDLSPDLIHANAVAAFVASPLFPEPDQLNVSHISALMALAIDEPAHKAAISLIAAEYSQKAA